MAAVVLESVAVPRPSSAFQRAAAPSPLPSPRMAVAAAGSHPWPECRGLRLAARAPRVPSPAAVVKAPRRRGVVCEASNTAFDSGPLQATGGADTPAPPSLVPDVTSVTWQSLVLEGEIPVLVDFWAEWCGPCRMILPIVEELSKEYAGRLKCLKINTDENPDIANQYGIRSIPTIIVFQNGEKKDAVIGAVPKSVLTSCVEKYL